MSHHGTISHMLESHPNGASNEKLHKLLEALHECVAACTACADVSGGGKRGKHARVHSHRQLRDYRARRRPPVQDGSGDFARARASLRDLLPARATGTRRTWSIAKSAQKPAIAAKKPVGRFAAEDRCLSRLGLSIHRRTAAVPVEQRMKRVLRHDG